MRAAIIISTAQLASNIRKAPDVASALLGNIKAGQIYQCRIEPVAVTGNGIHTDGKPLQWHAIEIELNGKPISGYVAAPYVSFFMLPVDNAPERYFVDLLGMTQVVTAGERDILIAFFQRVLEGLK